MQTRVQDKADACNRRINLSVIKVVLLQLARIVSEYESIISSWE